MPGLFYMQVPFGKVSGAGNPLDFRKRNIHRARL